jgi:serine/threonine protein kinase/Tol biopolymer transport system component
MIGETLSHFKITGKLGEGGMGEVWRAEDTKLGREVAIKVLPEAVAQDPERLARFEREAKVLASMNHPQIAAIYSIESVTVVDQPAARLAPQEEGEAALGERPAGPVHFLVMELAEGETLQERLHRGPMSSEEALPIALQIATAMEAAHARGIIHRDLKPANVKVAAGGQVKVLDFGLAKALDAKGRREVSNPDGASPTTSPLSLSPTLTAQMTQAGVLLGTAAYMSPEQARGQEADKRADIWAFGVMLQEMLTGQRLFAGDTVSDTLAAVLRADPDWESLPENTSRPVRRLLRRCLERDPNRRLHDIADARIEIEDALSRPEAAVTGEAATAETDTQPRWLRLLPWVLATMLAVVVGWFATRPDVEQANLPRRKLEVVEFGSLNPFIFTIYGAQISPDGSTVAYLSEGQLWLRRLDELESRVATESTFESGVIWSPDSQWLIYPAGRTLWKISATGGEAKAIADLPTNVGPFGGGWTDDGRIIFTTGYSGLLEVSAQGGDVSTILAPDPETEVDFHHALVLPQGKGVVFGIHYTDRAEGPLAIWDGQERRILYEVEGASLDTPIYSPTGHILYVRRPSSVGIWALPFSLDTLEVTGEPFLVARDVVSPSVATDGTLTYMGNVHYLPRQLVWLDRSGKEYRTVGVPQPGLGEPALSPDQSRVAVSAWEGNSREIWVQDLERGTKSQITFTPGEERSPHWSPDGRQLTYFTWANEPSMFLVDVEGRSEPLELGSGGRPSMTSDGKMVVFERFGARGIWLVELAEDGTQGEPVLIIDPPGDESEPTVSPDGRWLAYSGDETGRSEIYLTRFPSGEGKWQISTEGGASARWRPDGKEIFYINAQDSLEAVPIGLGSRPVQGASKVLFGGFDFGLGSELLYDVGRQGDRILVVREVGELGENPKLMLVQNWYSEFSESDGR